MASMLVKCGYGCFSEKRWFAEITSKRIRRGTFRSVPELERVLRRYVREHNATAADVTKGLEAVVPVMQAKAPNAVVVLIEIFPRNDKVAAMATIDEINTNLAKMVDGKKVRYLNVNDRLAEQDGKLFEGMIGGSAAHPTVKGYQVWADGLRPIFEELLGSQAKVDHAPAATGDPKAGR